MTNKQNSKYLTSKDTIHFLYTKIYITSPTVWKSIPPKGGRSLSTRMYCSFPCRGGTCKQQQKTTFPKESSNSTTFNLTRAVLYHKCWPSTQEQQQKCPALTDQTITSKRPFFHQIPKCWYMHINKAKSAMFWEACHQTPCCLMVADAGKSSVAVRESCTHSSPWLLGAEWEGGKAPVPTPFCSEEQNKLTLIRVDHQSQGIMLQ